jgi:hypothetical protein
VPDALLLYFPYALLNDRGDRHGDRADLSPLKFVSAQTPPTLCIIGDEDAIAPGENAIAWGEKMSAAANGAANDFRLFIYRKTHHPSGAANYERPGAYNDIRRQSDLFLAALGYVQGEPTVAPMTPEQIAALYVAPADFVPIKARLKTKD